MRPSLRWIVPVAVILLAVAAAGDSVESEQTTSTGVQVTMSVPFIRESIDEIRALAPFRTRAVPMDRAIPFHRIPRRSGATGEAGLSLAAPDLSVPFFASSPAPSAPVLDGSFAGLGNPPHSEGDLIPPDTMGAAGPNHLVSLLNSDFGVFSKTTGAVLQKIPLQSFWGSLGTKAGEPADLPFDTKVLYDPSTDRFFAVTLGGTSSPDSWILVAVSSTYDPTGSWNKWAIDADRDNDTQQFNNWADFPGVGLDGDNLYVSANMFSNSDSFQYGKVWVLPKAQLLSGSSSITWTEFRDPPGSSFNMQPAYTFGTAAAEYFLYEGSTSHLAVAWMDNTSGTPVWHFPLQVPVTPYISTGTLPGAPQLGNDNTISTSDTRLLNTVYRNGSIWTTHHLAVNGKVEVAWYRINPEAGTMESQGRISDPTRWYYYPSIAVNQDNVAAVGFSGSSPTEYAGTYYTVIRPPYGAADPVSLLKSGEAPYYKTGQSLGIPGGGTENRWGDYSATVVDPTDDVTFWTLQEYAQTPDPSTGSSRWGTWWGKFHSSDVLSPTGLTATVDNATQVTLRWTDPATNETGYVVERKTGAAGTFGVLTSPPLPPNSVTYIDTVGLVAGTTYYYRVGAVGSTGTSYSIEVPVTTPGSPPSSGGLSGVGGGGCLSISQPGGEVPFVTSLFSVGILLLPAFALGLRRFSRRRERTVPIRHPLC
ncbi:MAG: fibronectin type III domain-containing protein [Candidatus Deferrimicrobium sp.]